MSKCKLIIKDEVNIQINGLDIVTRRKIVSKLKYDLPYARHMPAFKLGRWDGTKTYFSIGGTGYLAHLDVILPIIHSDGYEIEVEDNRKPIDLKFQPITESYWADQGKVWPVGHRFAGEPIILRDDQANAVNMFLDNPQSLQSISTGAGKTITVATLSQLCEPYGRSMIIVPSKDLVLQTEEDYKNVGLDVGVYYGDRKEIDRTHTICTWQSLDALDKKNPDQSILSLAELIDGVTTVIVDECHVASGEILTKLLTQNFKHCPIRWGLTGTVPKEPYVYQGILASLGSVINKVTAKDLQDKGILADLHISVLQTTDIQTFKTYHAEYDFLVTDERRLKWMASKIIEMTATGNTLVLVNRIETGEMLVDLIPNSVFVNGKVKSKNRKSEYDEVKTSDDKVIIATFGVASTGINLPRIFNLVLIEPGKSFTRVIQSIGRGIRKADDKDYVDVYDITSTCKYAKKHLTERKRFYKEAQYPFTVTKVNI